LAWSSGGRRNSSQGLKGRIRAFVTDFKRRRLRSSFAPGPFQ